jgi:GNS1/SUR4 family
MDQVTALLQPVLDLNIEDCLISLFNAYSPFIQEYTLPIKTLLVQQINTLYPDATTHLTEWIHSIRCTHAHKLPFLDPFDVSLALLAYLFIITTGSIFMYCLPKLSLKPLVIIHNVILMLWSLYMGIAMSVEAYRNHYTLFANNTDNSPTGWPVNSHPLELHKYASGSLIS